MSIKVKYQKIEDGLIHSEKVVYIETADGTEEEVSVYKDLTNGYYLLVAAVEKKDDRVLIEFPNESASGRWRAWVNESNVVAI